MRMEVNFQAETFEEAICQTIVAYLGKGMPPRISSDKLRRCARFTLAATLERQAEDETEGATLGSSSQRWPGPLTAHWGATPCIKIVRTDGRTAQSTARSPKRESR